MWRHRVLLEWKINDHKHALWENLCKEAVIFLPAGALGELQHQTHR